MTGNNTAQPRVGLGVIIVNPKGEILVIKRQGSHAPYYSIPGGSLELGESFEAGAIREVKEETDLDIINPKVIALINNLVTYHEEGVHYAIAALLAKSFTGEPRVVEPEKCGGWMWADPHSLPLPHFHASQMAVECYLKNKFYQAA